jgi:hypothetical protein
MRTRCDTMSRPAPFRVSEAAALRVSRLSYTLRRVWPQTYVRHLHAREIRSRACGASTKTRLSRKPAVPRCLDRADDKRAPFSRRFIMLLRPSGERAGFLKYEKPPCELDQASANSAVAGLGEPPFRVRLADAHRERQQVADSGPRPVDLGSRRAGPRERAYPRYRSPRRKRG